MPISELIVRALIPAVLLIALVGIPLMLWWECRRPSSFTRGAALRGPLAAWRSLSTAEQAAQDAAAIEATAEAEAHAEEAGQVAVDRAVEINTLSRF